MDLWITSLIAAVYVALGRLIVRIETAWSHVAFALLNLAVVFVFWFAEDSKGWFAAYLLLVMLQYGALCVWGHRPGWLPWIAFLVPIVILLLVRYPPLPLVATFSGPMARKLAKDPDYPRLIAPHFVGLSYIAFRCSYLVLEIRNGVVKRPGFWEYLGFAFFAPTLSVGPISPYSLHRRGFAATERPAIPVLPALLRVLVGTVKYKFLGPILNRVTYSGLLLDGYTHPWIDLPVAAVAYYLFLCCNFSGFCDIAIGGAGLMGIPVAENFNNPFAARNMKDFWNRWHITLSQWMRDVVFSPLSKALVRAFGPAHANHAIGLTILVVFLLIGIWHGAGWNYAAFGAACAMGVAANHYYTIALKRWLGKERFIAYNKNRFIHAIAVAMTFSYFSASLFLFANDGKAMREIFSSLPER